jgi:hypothetical protein
MTDFARELPVLGSAILHEAAHLLQGLRVAPERAALVEGKRVTIFIAPGWEDDRTFSLAFTCRPWGHQLADWTRLVLWACSLAGGPRASTYRIALNPQGQYCLTACEPVEYVLRALYLDEARGLTAPARQGLTGHTTAHAAAGEIPGSLLPEIRVLRSLDGKMVVTMIAHGGHLEIVFETHTIELAGATVHLWRRSQDGSVLEPVADLTLTRGEEQTWTAMWTGDILPREQEFAFTFRPPSAPGGESS